VALNQWNVMFNNLEPGEYTVRAASADGQLDGVAAVRLPPPQEIRSFNKNAAFFATLRELQHNQDNTSHLLPPAALVEIWPWPAAAAMTFLLLNVLARRWPSSVAALRPSRGAA
jgi:hypothetical protein